LNSKAEAEKIVSQMTLEEKIGQMLMPDFRQWKQEGQAAVQDLTEMNDEVAEIIDEFDLGGVILFAQNVKTTEQTTKLIHDMQQVAINDQDGNLPLLTTIDQEGGIVTRLGTGTNFPGNMAIGATKNEQSSYDTGLVIGRELNSLGINVNFAPSVDINNNPLNPVIGLRSFSSNPDLVAKLGVKMIKGIQENGVSVAAKHFPGHGDTATDSHYGLPKVDKSLEELKEAELKPFQAAIDNGVDMIMTAHISYPQLEKDTVISKKDGSIIGIPATLSDDIITGIIRDKMHYDGIVITDAMKMQAIADHFGEEDAVIMAIKAGVDIPLMPALLQKNSDLEKLDNIVGRIKNELELGNISEKQINNSVYRILDLKYRRGILDLDQYNKPLEEKV
ncbi:MAG: glycoside hydrolase family 3 N-terminal domain-containing protein, partial [Anaerococcus sp.]|nr:glycoside hydrolase family 3 N-terminal domain-containing protein [Anaerococcus sp.]